MRQHNVRKWFAAALSALLIHAFAHEVHAQIDDAVRHVYDDLGRLVTTVNETGEFAEYVYDALGNIVEIRTGVAGPLAIFGFTPSRGGPGDTVVIEGQGFSPDPDLNTLSIGGVAATVLRKRVQPPSWASCRPELRQGR